MGREVKRVALDFDWPFELQWKGYMSPYASQKCKSCDGSGLNPATKELSDAWYDFERKGVRWCDAITQDEVGALIESGRLVDWTSVFIPGEGWKPKDPPYVPTAAEINTANKRSGLRSHDAINRWICIETRAKRLGVYGKCHVCDGAGEIWFNEHIKLLADGWYENERYDPPAGDGWQVWETVSEGSPITPVFPTREALIDYLVQYGDKWDQSRGDGGWSRKNAESFVGEGFAMSLMVLQTETGASIKAPRDGQFAP